MFIQAGSFIQQYTVGGPYLGGELSQEPSLALLAAYELGVFVQDSTIFVYCGILDKHRNILHHANYHIHSSKRPLSVSKTQGWYKMIGSKFDLRYIISEQNNIARTVYH